MTRLEAAARSAVVLLGGVLAAAIGWFLFIEMPTTGTDLLGILLVAAVVVLGLRIGTQAANALFPDYNVAEVAVEGPITRDGGSGLPPSRPGTPGADDIVELVERADEDRNVEALLLKLNTPGGAVVPSDDIRIAAERFDGPTVAYATDVCASGGYWIASGCDELWARDGSVVGSIGVRGSRVTAETLLENVGLEYEQLTAGEYKEAGVPLKDLDENEREYLQGIVDDYYEQFVETVAAGREMSVETLRETEARVYLGTDALEIGLVDEIGTRRDVEGRLTALIDAEASVTELEPKLSFAERLRGGAERVAYAAGMGVANRLVGEDGFRIRLD